MTPSKKPTVGRRLATKTSAAELSGYGDLLREIKERVAKTQLHASIAVNKELVLLYWSIGSDILRKQKEQGWGTKVIDRLAVDLGKAFPALKGFSTRNLKYMRAFAEAWPDAAIVQQAIAQLPWGHHVRLLDYVKDPKTREWYLRAAIAHGWSQNVLVHQIEGKLHTRQGQAVTNFRKTLPAPQSDLAHEILKDPYKFDFLTLGPDAVERDLEKGLLTHLRDFLLELGTGFSFVGSQKHLEVGGEDFYIDLLFYHLRLRCFVVIDLKMGDFKPEYAGKMNFYLSAVDDLLRHPEDRPSIGIVLCKSKNKVIAEYALREMSKPIGVATHQHTTTLPAELRKSLPSAAELEAQLSVGTTKPQKN